MSELSTKSTAKTLLQRQQPQGSESQHAPPTVYEALASPGIPLDASIRSEMEPRFECDFSEVRIHTDQRAAESASAVNALAYTVGKDIVFGEGRFDAHTRPGLGLLAHELAHVRQQSNGWSDRPLEIAPSSGTLEAEAQIASESILSGSPFVGAITRGSPAAVSRSAAGDVVGGTLGAAAGAALGMLAGPVGAVLGGVVGGLTGLMIGGSLTGRSLNGPEETEAKLIYGNSIDFKKVRLTESVIALPVAGFAPFNTIYFPPGTFAAGGPSMPLLIHELMHVWQTQNLGYSSIVNKIPPAVKGAAAYQISANDKDHNVRRAALREATARGKQLADFNTEQQAEIMEWAYIERNGMHTSVYKPFLDEVQGVSSGSPLTVPANAN